MCEDLHIIFTPGFDKLSFFFDVPTVAVIIFAAVCIHSSLAPACLCVAGMSYTHFAEQHAVRDKFLSQVLYDHLVWPDAGDFLSRTGSLVRCRNLRNKKNRKTFHDIVAAVQDFLYGDKTARFWTSRVVSDAISGDLPSNRTFF